MTTAKLKYNTMRPFSGKLHPFEFDFGSFIHEGTRITNPFTDETNIFFINPFEYYKESLTPEVIDRINLYPMPDYLKTELIKVNNNLYSYGMNAS